MTADNPTEDETPVDAEHSPESGPERSAPLGANYFRLFAATTVSNLGDGIGLIAYPWLASAVTRSPLLIALVAVVQRLPWLIFTLPAGVITDRYSRRNLMVGANLFRAVLTGLVALLVLGRQSGLPGPDELTDGAAVGDTDVSLYLIVIAATLLLGFGEVLYDNAAQTFLPRIVDGPNLERANGRMWSAEMIANTFVGPPLGAWLLLGVFALPFVVDAATFAVSAALIGLIAIPATATNPAPSTETETETETGAEAGETGTERGWFAAMGADIAEGFGWLWRHDFLRRLAIILGLMNMLGTMAMASLVLFAQEELETNPTEFAIMGFGSAIGGIIGGWTASMISKRIGTGPSLALTLIGGGATNAAIAFTSSWVLVSALFAIFMLLAVLWNVITVSLRQTIIPDELLGRVNSVYRFFAWGMMPIGALAGGLIVTVAELGLDRGLALRAPWVVAGIGQILIFVFGGRYLTTARIEEARSEGTAPSEG